MAESVRDRILDSALALLSRVGARGLAQPQVAKEAGVPQGHLTYYFPKKIDLLAAVAERFAEQMRAEVATFAGLEPIARRKKAIAFAVKLASNRARTRTLLGLVVEMEQDAALRARVGQQFGMLRAMVSRLIDRDLDDPDVDIALAAMWGIGLQHLVLEGQRTEKETEALLKRVLAHFDDDSKRKLP